MPSWRTGGDPVRRSERWSRPASHRQWPVLAGAPDRRHESCALHVEVYLPLRAQRGNGTPTPLRLSSADSLFRHGGPARGQDAVSHSLDHLGYRGGGCVGDHHLRRGDAAGALPARTSYWFPRRSQGSALGAYAGIGNIAPGLFALLLGVAIRRAPVRWPPDTGRCCSRAAEPLTRSRRRRRCDEPGHWLACISPPSAAS